MLTHLFLVCTAGWRASLEPVASVTISLSASVLFVVAMTLLLLSALSDEEGRTTRGWVTPIVLGTLGAQLASALWYPAIERHENCAGEISAWYFSNMSYMFALILLTLCVELNFLRRNPMDHDAGQRVAPLFTVIMISLSMPLSFTVLVKTDMPRCGIAAVWHEYFTFVFTAQALIIGLATVVWLLIRSAAQSGTLRNVRGSDLLEDLLQHFEPLEQELVADGEWRQETQNVAERPAGEHQHALGMSLTGQRLGELRVRFGGTGFHQFDGDHGATATNVADSVVVGLKVAQLVLHQRFDPLGAVAQAVEFDGFDGRQCRRALTGLPPYVPPVPDMRGIRFLPYPSPRTGAVHPRRPWRW